MQIHLREASRSDAVTLARLNYTVQKLHVEAVPGRYKRTTPDDVWVISTFERLLSDENGCIYLAEVADEAVGYVYCKVQQVEENAFVHAYTSLHIDQMSVREDFQGHGVGHVLMEQVFALARRLNIGTVTLGVNAFNEQAQVFYRKHGFEVTTMRMAVTLPQE